MSKNIMIGQKFGLLTVIADSGERSGTKVRWLCRCDCGNLTKVRTDYLRSGHTKSCGCLVSKNLVGQKFGKLLVIEDSGLRDNRHIKWKCLCECGNYCYSRGTDLLLGETISCGCEKSKGERFISTFLQEHNISYSIEYKFPDLMSRKNYPLRFDFAIFDNKQLVGLIEFDGIQHFKQTFNNESLEDIQERDLIKTNYCLEHNIPLLRLPYTLTKEEIKQRIYEFLKL